MNIKVATFTVSEKSINTSEQVQRDILQYALYLHLTALKNLSGAGDLSVLLDSWLTVKAAASIFISGCGSTISSAKEGKSGFIYNLVKSF